MNPGWLLSKTWASIARLPFSLYLKQFREYKKNSRKRFLSFSFIYPIVITINLSTRKLLTCQLVNSSTCLLVNLKESSPERRCSSRTFRYGYLVTT